VTPARADTLIVLAADQVSLYEFLRARQGSDGGSVAVVLDRRTGERRRHALPVPEERRQRQRRHEIPEAARALLRVLGFAILHRAGSRYRV
jgi:hypothetical protein